MYRLPRFAQSLLMLTAATVALGSCASNTDIDDSDNVTIRASFTGDGRIYSPDPSVSLDCVKDFAGTDFLGCDVGFFDAGAGGTIEVVAEPDAGWSFDSWSQDCDGFTTTTCTLTFSSTPADFVIAATFVVVPDAIVLSDDFNAHCDDWSSTFTTSGVPGTPTESCRPAGGVGGAGDGYREMTHELPGEGTLVVDHQYDGATVLAGAGGGGATCIATVRFSERRVISSPAFAGAAVGSSVWIIQDGVRYRASLGQFTDDTGWTAWDSGALTAADFTPAGLDLCPTVSTPLTFGYARSNSNTNPSATQLNVHAIDEWSVTIQPSS